MNEQKQEVEQVEQNLVKQIQEITFDIEAKYSKLAFQQAELKRIFRDSGIEKIN